MAQSYKGNAIVTTITTDIASGDLTIGIADSSGWPSGAGGKPFVAEVIAEDGLTREKVLVASRTGLSLSVASRGYDDTIAAAFVTGADIEHVFDAASAQRFDDHLYDTEPHADSDLLRPATHDVAARHTFDNALLAAGSSTLVGAAQTPGSGNSVARGNHGHALDPSVAGAGLALTAGVLAVIYDDVTVTVTGDTLQIKAGGVANAHLGSQIVETDNIAPLNVTSALIAADAVIAGKIADGAVDVTAALADGIVTLAKLDATTLPIVGAWTAYTPTTSGSWVKGNGTTAGRYMKIGKTLFWHASFVQGSTSTMNGQGGLSLPGGFTLNGTEWSGTCKYRDDSTGEAYMGAWISTSSSVIVCKTVEGDGNTGARGDASGGGPAPFAWSVGDEAYVTGMAEVN